jgi:peroxiredoxin
MKMRWLMIALAAVVVFTLLTWVPIGGPGDASPGLDRGPGEGGVGRGGCPANAEPANLDFTLKDMYGRDVRLADYKGKVLLINFWATWCGPCLVEIPGFVELQAKYKARGFEIVGISITDGVEELRPFAREFAVNYPLLVGRDRDDVQEAFGPITGVPVSVLVGKHGRICAKQIGLAPLEQFERDIKALL